MHKTLCPKILGYVDSEYNGKGRGWAFYEHIGCCPIRGIVTNSKGDKISFSVKNDRRQDVADYYGGFKIYINSGWEYDCSNIEDIVEIELEIFVEKEWKVFHRYKQTLKVQSDTFTTSMQSYLVVDNFLIDPDAYRAYALEQTYGKSNGSAGYRTHVAFRPDSFRERFEQLLGRKIRNWDNYPINGCFQYCTQDDHIVYHCDTQEYAGIIYLTPNAPPESGTTLLKSKKNGLMKLSTEPDPDVREKLIAETFENGFLDGTLFDPVDKIGNVYNRLVLWDGHIIHSASSYFGTDITNARLFQIFFFDLEK